MVGDDDSKVTATLRKNVGLSMPKQNNDSCIQEDQEP